MSSSLPPLASSLSELSSGDQEQYNFNSKVMVAAMLLLCIVVLFVVSLHVYAKWFWRGRGALLPQSNAAREYALWRRRWRMPVEAPGVDGTLVPTISTGLDSATVSSLPTFIYETSKHHNGVREPLLECAVCLSEFQANEKGRLLPNCKHSFHIGCIDMWFRSHSTCPLCREPVSPWPAPQHHADQNAPASLPTRAYLQNDQLIFHLSLQSPSSPVSNQFPLHQRAAITPPLPLQCNRGVHIQTEGLAKINDELDTHREVRSSYRWRDCGGECSCPSSSIEIQLGQAESSTAIARSQSLPRCQSETGEACSLQPALKSRSFRISIKRLLSRDVSRGKGRIFPAGAEQDHPAQDQHSSALIRSSFPLSQEEEG